MSSLNLIPYLHRFSHSDNAIAQRAKYGPGNIALYHLFMQEEIWEGGGGGGGGGGAQVPRFSVTVCIL